MKQHFLKTHPLFNTRQQLLGLILLMCFQSLPSFSNEGQAPSSPQLWVKSITCESGAVNPTFQFKEGKPADLGLYKLMSAFNLFESTSENTQTMRTLVDGSRASACMNDDQETTLTVILTLQ